jgi:prepilin-type processing-associated H-X9-DG protein
MLIMRLPLLLLLVLVSCAARGSYSANPTVGATQPATQPIDSQEEEAIKANLRHIGLTLLLYIDNHNGRYPDDLGSLVVTEGDAPQCYVLPYMENEVPINWQAMSPQAQREWINNKSAFTYIGKSLEYGQDYSSKTSLTFPQIVVAYQTVQPSAVGTNILYFDSHVEFDNWNAAKHRIDQTQALLQTLEGK